MHAFVCVCVCACALKEVDSRVCVCVCVVCLCAGLKEKDFDAIEDLETTYDVRFEDHKRRNEFVNLLLDGHNNALAVAAQSAVESQGPRVCERVSVAVCV